MSAVALNMANKNYQYFETNPRPLTANHTIDQTMNMDMSITADPSLQAPAFWRVFPHVLGFIFIYLFGGMYFNDDIFYYFPIMFFFPSLLFIFICFPNQFMFDKQNIPSFVNSLSWGFWFGGLSLYIVLTTFNHTVPSIMPPAPDQNGQHETHNFFQEQIVFTALCLTSLIEEITKCYLCHRSFSRFHGLGASTSSINMLLLNCTLNATGMAIAKGFLALCLIGNAHAQTDVVGVEEVIYDYKYALLHYVPKAFVYNESMYPVIMTVIYALAILPLHTMLGALWGIGFIRRFVLEHTIAFGQILMFPWFFHFVVNLVIAEVFYNVIDGGFKDTMLIYIVTSVVPIIVTLIAVFVFWRLFRRKIDRSISQLHVANMNINSADC